MTTLKSPGGAPTDVASPLDWATANVERLRNGQPDSDRAARVPEELTNELAASGAFSLTTPAHHGGLQTTLANWMDVVVQLGRGDGGVAWAVTLVNACNWIVATTLPRPVADEVFSGPVPRTAGVLAPRGFTGRAVDGGLLIEGGTWAFNSGIDLAAWDLLGVLLPGPDGALAVPGFALVPSSDVVCLHDWDTIGLRGSGSSTVTATNVFVPAERLVNLVGCAMGDYGGGFGSEPLYRAAFMPVMAIVLTFPLLGLGQHMLEATLANATGRPVAFSPHADRSRAPVSHHALGQAAAKLDAARLLMAASCSAIDAWANRGEEMPYLERASVRLHTGAIEELVWDAVDLLSREAGGPFAQESNVLSRIWRDAKVAMSHGMVSPSTNYELYGRALSGVIAPEALI